MSSDARQLANELNSAAIHLLRRIRQTDRSLALTPVRLSALSVLVFDGPMNITRLAEAEQVTGPTMSRIVAALEERDLIRREQDPDDGRGVLLTATDRGRNLIEQGRSLRVEALAGQLSELDETDRQTLHEAVRILRALENPDG